MTVTTAARDRAQVQRMVAAAEAVASYTKGGRQRFLDDPIVQDAVAWRLEMLGLAARRVSEPFREAHPQVPWRSFAALGDLLVPDVAASEPERVWSAVAALRGTLTQLRRLTEG